MVFILRGFGIVIPITFFLSAWSTGYWCKDMRLLKTN